MVAKARAVVLAVTCLAAAAVLRAAGPPHPSLLLVSAPVAPPRHAATAALRPNARPLTEPLGTHAIAGRGLRQDAHQRSATSPAGSLAAAWASLLAVASPLFLVAMRLRRRTHREGWAVASVSVTEAVPGDYLGPVPLASSPGPATATAPSSTPVGAALPPTVRIAVLGDLHLDPREMSTFHECRDHIVDHLRAAEHRRVISLGDLGGYKANPGSQQCFDTAKAFLDGFGAPVRLVTGNHDLEGAEFPTDAENLAAWCRTFSSEPYWAQEVAAGAVCIGLSTTRFRDSPGSCHEVHITEEQFAWFERTLQRYATWNVFVFSHAPILGCGLKALQKVHIKNMCAWLNHSDRPQRFIQLVQRSPQVRAWFSGHFHLSHDYVDSISVVGKCTFVQVGVMGESSQRDKRRQTRLLDIRPNGFRIHTINHHTGGEEPRLDLEFAYDDADPPLPENAKAAAAACDRGFVACGDTGMFLATPPADEDGCVLRADGRKECWYHAPNGALLEALDNQLLEYDAATQVPIGLVHLDLRDREVRVDSQTGNVLLVGVGPDGREEVEVIAPNPDGTYRRVFQTNKWRLRLQKEAQERAAAEAQVPVMPVLY